METMNQQMQDFVRYVQNEMLQRQAGHTAAAIVPLRRTINAEPAKEKKSKS
jgi:hypothetical protein